MLFPSWPTGSWRRKRAGRAGIPLASKRTLIAVGLNDRFTLNWRRTLGP